MKYYLSLLLLLTSINSQGQIQKTWDQVLGSMYDEEPVLIYANPSGTVDVIANVVGINNSNAQGVNVNTGYGSYDIWFGRIDKNGNILKDDDATFGDILEDRAKCAIRTTDGGYLICARTTGPNLPSFNTSALRVIKIDTTGKAIWDKVLYMHDYVPSGNGTADLTGDIVACNISSGYVVDVAVRSNGSMSSYFNFSITFDINGNNLTPIMHQSGKTINDILLPKSMLKLANGNLGLCGKNNSRNHFLRLNASAALPIVSYMFASNGYSEIISVKELNNGDLVFFSRSVHDNQTGSVRTINSKASSGNHDIWVFRINSVNSGGLKNETAIGCGALNIANTNNFTLSNIYYKDDLAYLLLEPNAKGVDHTSDIKGETDYWFITYDYLNNKIVNQKSWGGKLTEKAQSIFVDDNKNVYLLGTSNSVKEGDKTKTVVSGITDLWIIKACLGVDPPEITASSNVISPTGSGYFVMQCTDSPLEIKVKNPNPQYIYTWYKGATQLTTGPTLNIPPPHNNVNYTLKVDNGSCSYSTIITTLPFDAPKPIITGKTTICAGAPLFLVAKNLNTNSNDSNFYKTHWYDGNTLIHTGDTLSIAQPTNKTYQVKTEHILQNPTPIIKCESDYTQIQVVIEEVPAPTVSFTQPNCRFDNTSINVSNGTGYIANWYDDANNLLSSSNPFIYYSKTSKDSIYCKLINNIGCPSEAEKIIIEPVNETPPIPSIANTFEINTAQYLPTCEKAKAIITIANSSYNYSWYSSPTSVAIASGATYTTTIINPANNYTFWVDANNGKCTSNKRQVVIEKLKSPIAPKITAPVKACRGDMVIMTSTKDTANAGGGIIVNVWTNSLNQIISYGDSLIIPAIDKTDKYYCYTMDSIPPGYYPGLNDFKCMSPSSTKEIKVDTVITPKLIYPTINCVGTNVNIKVANLVNASANWYKSNGQYLGSGTVYTIMNIPRNDTIICEAVGTNGCRSKTITIIETEKPTALFSATKVNLAPGDATQFKDQSIDGGKTHWLFGDGNYSTTINPYNYYNSPGKYTVTLISESPNGCVDTLVKKDYIIVSAWIGINENELIQIKVYPNPFHDKITISLPSEIKTASVTIYNTLGESVITNAHYSGGEINTGVIPQGFYILELKLNGLKHTIKIIKN